MEGLCMCKADDKGLVRVKAQGQRLKAVAFEELGIWPSWRGIKTKKRWGGWRGRRVKQAEEIKEQKQCAFLKKKRKESKDAVEEGLRRAMTSKRWKEEKQCRKRVDKMVGWSEKRETEEAEVVNRSCGTHLPPLLTLCDLYLHTHTRTHTHIWSQKLGKEDITAAICSSTNSQQIGYN